MKAKLFLFYIRYRKPIILGSGLLTLFIVGLNYWQEYQATNVDRTRWQVTHVQKGNKLTLYNGDEAKTIKLCGVETAQNESQDFLQRVIDLGDGTVDFQQVGDDYEAWILIDKNYDVELVSHISNEPDYLVGETIHLNTWMIERGFARRDRQNSSQCSQPENLVWAEKLAKEKKLGMWR